MEVKEYRPRNGWVAYRKRASIALKIKSTLMAFAAFAVYAAMVTLTETI